MIGISLQERNVFSFLVKKRLDTKMMMMMMKMMMMMMMMIMMMVMVVVVMMAAWSVSSSSVRKTLPDRRQFRRHGDVSLSLSLSLSPSLSPSLSHHRRRLVDVSFSFPSPSLFTLFFRRASPGTDC